MLVCEPITNSRLLTRYFYNGKAGGMDTEADVRAAQEGELHNYSRLGRNTRTLHSPVRSIPPTSWVDLFFELLVRECFESAQYKPRTRRFT